MKNRLTNIGIAIILVVLIWVLMFIMTSCKLFKEVKSSRSDSASVKKQSEQAFKADTSKSKTESSNTKETVYYPQPIIVPGKDGETKVIFVPQSTKETGTQKTEDNSYKFEDLRKEFLDSLSKSKQESEMKKTVKVGFSTFEIIVLCVFGLILLKMFSPSILNFFTKK